MKGVRLWLLNAITVLSVLLCLTTVGAWIFSGENPWSVFFQYNALGSHDAIAAARGMGHWRVLWTQDRALDGDWGWRVSADGRYFDAEFGYWAFDWETPWWKLILLWLVLPFLRFAPWRSSKPASDVGGPDPSSKLSRWGRPFRGPPIHPIPGHDEIKNIAVAYCLAAYMVAAIMAVVALVENIPADGALIFTIMWIEVLAPIAVPIVLLLLSDNPEAAQVFITTMWASYLLFFLAIYLWRANRKQNDRAKQTALE
jgi:hypothetical protein